MLIVIWVTFEASWELQGYYPFAYLTIGVLVVEMLYIVFVDFAASAFLRLTHLLLWVILLLWMLLDWLGIDLIDCHW